MSRDAINRDYYTWLSNFVYDRPRPRDLSYEKLLKHLHETIFRWTIPRDENRSEDGIELRYRFATNVVHDIHYQDVLDQLDGECSMLEMMIALAIRCEENIMDEFEIGDRTGQWFWTMINNLGLGSMTDRRYDPDFVDDILEQFFNHDYSADGRGGLFRVRYDDRDMRDMEIWHQLCAYLDEI